MGGLFFTVLQAEKAKLKVGAYLVSSESLLAGS